MNNNAVNVMILAGGQGTRLKTMVSDRQKAVASVNGRPFILFLLEQLRKIEINKLIICTGHLQETVRKELERCPIPFNLVFSPEQTPLGTGGAIRNALPLTETEHVLVMNGDSFIDCDLNAFCSSGRIGNRPAQMLLAAVEDVSRFGRVELDEQNLVTAFAEKDSGGAGHINAGVYLFKSTVIRRIPENIPYSLEKQFFPRLVAARELYGYPCRGRFIDIGTPESYAGAENFLENFSGEGEGEVFANKRNDQSVSAI